LANLGYILNNKKLKLVNPETLKHSNKPTPFLVENVERTINIDTKELYGDKFLRSSVTE